MGLDLWFKDDVARILASSHETMRAMSDNVHAGDDVAAYHYRQGFEDALRAVGLAFGVTTSPPSVRVIDAQMTLPAGNGGHR